MWGSKRARWIKRPGAVELAKKASHLRDLHRLIKVETRKDARQAAGEHGLAGARGTTEQQVMTARRGDLERTFSLLLPVDLGQVVLEDDGLAIGTVTLFDMLSRPRSAAREMLTGMLTDARGPVGSTEDTWGARRGTILPAEYARV